jgi:hypothetical protein
MRRYRFLIFTLALLAMGFPTDTVLGSPARDLTVIKQNIEVFEGILTTVLRQSFAEPFAVLEKPKGVYLEGFGVVFAFEVDIATVKPRDLFSSSVATPEEEKKAFNERFPRLKEVMTKALAEHGDSITMVGPEEQIVIVAHLFDAGWLSRPLELKTVFVRTTKKNILDFKGGRLSYEDLKKKLEWVQY